jgi:hypothetical protein
MPKASRASRAFRTAPIGRGDLDDRFRGSKLEFPGGSFDFRGCCGRRERCLEFARVLRRAVARQPLPDRQKRCPPDLAGTHRHIALNQERLERKEQMSRRIFGADSRILAWGPDDFSQFLEYEGGDCDIFATLEGALILPHQQRQ